MASSPMRQQQADPKHSYGSIPLHDPVDIAPAPPIASASLWSKLFFSYANPVLALGNTRQLSQSDLWTLEGDNRTSTAFQAFKTNYVACGGSVERALLATYGGDFLICGLGSLVAAACGVFAPVVLHHVIDAFSAPVVDTRDLALWLGAFVASRVVNAMVSCHMRFRIEMVLIRLTVSLKSLIFEKAMRRSVQSKHEADSVDISNLFTADMDNFIWLSSTINSLWILPIQIVVVVYMLYRVLDLAAFAGAAVMTLSLLVNYFVSKTYSDAYDSLTELKDNRMRAVKEAFGAIQIVKLNAWEDKFFARIQEWRGQELSVIKRYMYMVAVAVFLFWSTPIFVSVTSFATYALVMKETLTAAKVFTSMMLFNAVAESITEFPEAIQGVVQSRVSLRRVAEYLSADEIDCSRISHDSSGCRDDVMVSIEDLSITWATRSKADEPDANRKVLKKDNDEGTDSGASVSGPLLSNVNLKVERGDFVVVYGAVGAGKSSLCAALLGEIPMTSGKVFVRSEHMAYYSQQPWIQNMSVRDNILFGQAYDADKYERVLDACGLVTDVQQFPAGDATEIGQKGINLSGGQKARLSLARACYSDANVFILDSPLAAVDAVVQSEIFSKCICGLLESKTVILVTHNPEIIASRAVDVRVEVSNGGVRCERSPRHQARHLYGKLTTTEEPEEGEATDFDSSDAIGDGVLVEDEERQAGRVSNDIIQAYVNAIGGYKALAVFLAVLITWQSLQVSSDVWLSHWTGNKDPSAVVDSVGYNLTVYAALASGAAVAVLIRSTLGALLGIRAAGYLFNRLTESLLHAPMRFFDANPIGRIINRYAEDVSTVDLQLHFDFFGVFIVIMISGFRLVATLVVIRTSAIFVIPLGWAYVRLGQYYLATSREITRLLKVANSPVLNHVAVSEEGVTVLRGFGQPFVNRAIDESYKLIDINNQAWFAEVLVNQWFAIRIQLLGCGLVALVVASLVWLREYLPPGLVGLAFMYSISVEGELANLVRYWGEFELAMVSPERIMEYVGIAAEGDDKVVSFDASAHPEWPQRGRVAFEDVVFAYKPGGAAVLKRVSFEVLGREKVGIVGRTGAGKSSLTMALFRINELEAGRIVIDGVDIACVDVRALRSRLSIIPQSPVLFKGSLRAYMDPFDEFSDASIWSAVEKAGLKDLVTALDGGLWHELSENGENLSVGERQLLCLSRALLREARVVVLDEATASIDHATERRLQAMIAREFASATVLTIAHRLATVLESDRILVLDSGRVVEFDTPRSLAQKGAGGVFYELAREGGYLDVLL